jgi:hypothetical protein
LPGGEYIADSGSVGSDYTYDYRQIATGTQTEQRQTWEESTWYGKTTYYVKTVDTTPEKDIHAHSIRADRTINVEFIGYKEGDAAVQASITSKGSILVNDSIQNAVGTTTLDSEKQIRLINDNAIIGGKNIILDAASGIGSDKTLRTNLTDGKGGALDATTTAGNISIRETSGDLKVGQVTTDKTNGDITLTAYGDIAAEDAASLVRGGKITLTASYGAIGSLGTGGTATSPGAGALPLRIDTGDTTRDSLAATASDNIYLQETAGSLHVNSVETSGDVRVEVLTGDLIDQNTVEVKDTRTEQQLLQLYDKMLATDATAGQSIDATIAAYESVKTRDYQAYWRYLNSFGGTYSASQQVTLSAAEVAYYTDYYTNLGQNAAAAITTLENQRTAEYHTLHATYGNVTATYNAGWAYDVDDITLHQRFGAAAVSASKIELTSHVFTTGQAVVYHSGGGSISGLTDGSTYYIVVDTADPSKVSLAATQANATATTPVSITLGAVTGTGNYFSDGDVLRQRAAWSESQLKNSVSASILRPKTVSGTTATTEDPNITGHNIFLSVSGAIGISTGQMDINLPLTAGLSDAQKIALAAAERQDVTFYDAGGNVMQADDVGRTIASISITLMDDVDLKATGKIGGSSGAAGANIGSDQSSDLQIDRLTSAGGIRVKTQGSIINARTDSAYNIQSNGLILEAETGYIGTSAKSVLIDMTGAGSLTARADSNVYIRETSGDLNVSAVYANDYIDLRAQGSLLDADNDDATTQYWNIYSESAYLEAGASGTIGAAGHFLETDLQGNASTGAINALAGGSIYLTEVTGDMFVGQVKSISADVSLKADVSILDNEEGVLGNPAVDVYGNSLYLTAEYGTIGASGDALDIKTAYSGAGTLTSSSEFNTYLIETAGNLSLNTVQTNAGTAFISAPAGSIVNGNPGGTNVISGKTWLFASQDIGESANPITAIVGNIEGKSTMGSTWVSNAAPLTVGGVVTGDDPGMYAGGSITISSECPITIGKDITASMSEAGDIVIQAVDTAAAGDDVTIHSGITVRSTGGAVTLLAGDNVLLEAGSTVTAAGKVTIKGDYQNSGIADPDAGVGSTITIQGAITGSELEIDGNNDNDTVTVTSTTIPTTISTQGGADTVTILATTAAMTINGGTGNDTVNLRTFTAPVTVNAGDGNDTVNVGTNAPGTAGTLNQIGALLTVNGEGGSDTLNLDDTNDATANTGTLTATSITGLGMTTGITYATFETLNISLGSGADTFLISSTHANTTNLNMNGGADTVNVRTISGTTTVNMGSGNDTVNVGTNAPGTAGTLNQIGALLTVNGEGGSDTLNVDDTNDAAANTGILTSTRLTGLGMGNADQSIVNAALGITYGTFDVLNISLGSGSDTFTFDSTFPATTTTLNTAAGADTINVHRVDSAVFVNAGTGDDVVNVHNSANMVNEISGLLTLRGDGGNNILNVDDSGDVAGNTGTLTGTRITGLGMGSADQNTVVSSLGIDYGLFNALNVRLGSGLNHFNITVRM